MTKHVTGFPRSTQNETLVCSIWMFFKKTGSSSKPNANISGSIQTMTVLFDNMLFGCQSLMFTQPSSSDFKEQNKHSFLPADEVEIFSHCISGVFLKMLSSVKHWPKTALCSQPPDTGHPAKRNQLWLKLGGNFKYPDILTVITLLITFLNQQTAVHVKRRSLISYSYPYFDSTHAHLNTGKQGDPQYRLVYINIQSMPSLPLPFDRLFL